MIDIRCDAYGHGSDWVSESARELGFSAFLTDDDPIAPIPESTGLTYGTEHGVRVAVVSAELVAIKTIPAGDSVSYGYTWTAPAESRIGLVSLGFADGLPRAGSNTASLTVAGHEVPIIGRIAMDQCVVNLSGVDAQVGDVVSTWETVESVTVWANAARRAPLSLVSGLSWRVERSWI